MLYGCKMRNLLNILGYWEELGRKLMQIQLPQHTYPQDICPEYLCAHSLGVEGFCGICPEFFRHTESFCSMCKDRSVRRRDSNMVNLFKQQSQKKEDTLRTIQTESCSSQLTGLCPQQGWFQNKRDTYKNKTKKSNPAVRCGCLCVIASGNV